MLVSSFSFFGLNASFYRICRRLAPESTDNDDEAKTTRAWGRHYTWPASTLPFQLEMAMRKVQVKKETEKALKKSKGMKQ